jgi:hypothetical protein
MYCKRVHLCIYGHVWENEKGRSSQPPRPRLRMRVDRARPNTLKLLELRKKPQEEVSYPAAVEKIPLT